MQPATKRKVTLAACCSAHAVQDGLGAALYVLMPILAQTFGLSYALVGIIRAVSTAAMTVFELVSSLLAERLGERNLLVFGLIAAAAGYFWLAAAGSLTAILVSLFVLGIGSAFQHALASSVIARTFNNGGQRAALGLYNSSGDAGKLAFTALFGLATGIGLAWHGVVAAFAVITLVTAPLVYIALARAGTGTLQPAEPDAGKPVRRTGWGIKDRTGFTALVTTVFIDTAVQSAFLVFVAFVFTEKGIATHLAAAAVVLTLIGGMFGKAGCGYLAERLGARFAFTLVQCATAACILALVAAPALPAFFLLPVLGMFLQGSTSITYGSVVDVFAGERQSRGFALIYAVSAPSMITGPIGFGVISDHSGLSSALIAMAALSLLAIPTGLYLKPRGAREQTA